jgi:hypothetical protein
LIDAEQVVQQEEGQSQEEIAAALGGNVRNEGLPAAEVALLAFLGAKVVLPIVTSFAGREIWERFNRIRSRKQAEKAREELAGRPLTKSEIAPAEVMAPIIASLLEEGIPEEKAAQIATSTYGRIAERVAGQTSI